MNTKNQSLLLIDAVAVIIIVFFHALAFYPPAFYPLDQYSSMLRFLGLALFSFSAGYKLMYNHRLELQNREFLKQYMVKRFKRLYKPYIGYTLLVLPPFYAVIWIAKNLFSLDYPGLSLFDKPMEDLVWDFMIGEPPVTPHLWYLVMLLEVTFFCLFVLYAFNLKVLFGMGFTLGLSFLFFQDYIEFEYLYRIIIYGTIFIIGIFFSTKVALPEKITVPLLTPLIMIGSYSFYIYLFQTPFLVPIPGRILGDILHIRSIFVPIFLTIFTVVASIIIYQAMKAFRINRLFE